MRSSNPNPKTCTNTTTAPVSPYSARKTNADSPNPHPPRLVWTDGHRPRGPSPTKTRTPSRSRTHPNTRAPPHIHGIPGTRRPLHPSGQTPPGPHRMGSSSHTRRPRIRQRPPGPQRPQDPPQHPHPTQPLTQQAKPAQEQTMSPKNELREETRQRRSREARRAGQQPRPGTPKKARSQREEPPHRGGPGGFDPPTSKRREPHPRITADRAPPLSSAG